MLPMIVINCSELSADEELALAGQISDEMSGSVLALVKATISSLTRFPARSPSYRE